MNSKGSRKIRIPLAAAMLVLVSIMAVSPVLAQEPVSGWSAGDDEGPLFTAAPQEPAWEVGCHSGVGDSLEAHGWHEAWGTCYALRSCGWTQRYLYNKSYAWEEDFKRAALGGKEHLYLDTVDLQFYVGHGGPGGFTFWNSCCDDCCLTPNDCYRSWGNGDNEWVALTSCSVLADSNVVAWSRCMYGTHLILGFKTTAYARYPYYNTQGYWFGRYLCAGYTVPQAWYRAADRVQKGRVVRTLINELACLNDRPATGWVCADSYDWDAWMQTHTAGSEPAGPVDLAVLNGAMPRYKFRPFTLADAEAKYEMLGGVFEVPTTLRNATLLQDGDAMWNDVSGGREVEMDSGSGLYAYTDLNTLWTTTDTQRIYAMDTPMLAPDQAREIADQFLQGNDLMPEDALYYETAEDTISGGDIATDTLGVMGPGLLQNEQTEVYQVIYSRKLSYEAPAAAGGAPTMVTFDVVGPGAKQKVYVSTDAARRGTLAANASPILGVLGGWRAVQEPVPGSGPEGVEMVDILTPEQIYKLFEEVPDFAVLDMPPIDFDHAEIISHTVAYWEEGATAPQSELTPVYALSVRFSNQGEVVAEDPVHIPANETYMNPYAGIESAPSQPVRVGDQVSLTATEASRTLTDLGFDALLNFALGSGQPEDYTYTWLVQAAGETREIGTGRSIDYTVAGFVDVRTGEVPQQAVTVQVTDITNPDQTSSTASVTLNVYPRVLLPLVMKQY